MDNCKGNVEAISMLVDGELDDARAQALRAHIAQCDTCRRVYDAFSSISDCVGDDLVQPPVQLAKGIMFKINLLNERKHKSRFAYGRFTAIAACLVVILLGANYFGLLGGSPVLNIAGKGSVDAKNESLEESTAMDREEPASDKPKKIITLDKFFFNDDLMFPAEGDNPASLTAGADNSGNMSQFAAGTHVIDEGGAGLAEELRFQTYLEELVTYADENPPAGPEEAFAFFKEADSEEKIPVTIRIYEGEYVKSEEKASATNMFGAPKNEAEQLPAAEFADLDDLRVLNTLLTDAEETDKTFDSQPSYTIALFDGEGKIMDEKVVPLRIWIHGGHIYFEADAEGTLLRAAVKPDELVKLIESLKE